jgi:hypothetical protein
VQEFALHILKAEREGDAAIDLRDVVIDQTRSDAEMVLGLPILRFDPMLIVAKAGDGKSLLLAKTLGDLNLRGYRVGLLDAEWNEYEHHKRLVRLYGSALPSVKYLRLQRPLSVEADRVRRFVFEEGLDFIALDSVGQAVDAPLETSEAANNFYRVLRGLGRRGLVLSSHVKHDSATEGSSKRAYGSSYWMAGARAVWFLKSAPLGSDRLEMVLEQVKVNADAHRPPIGLHVRFGERIAIDTVAAVDLQELSSSLPLRERIASLLKRRGALTKDEIADELAATPEAVKKALQRAEQMFVKVDTAGDRVLRFGLRDHQRGAA